MELNTRPLRRAQHHERDLTTGQVLLVAHVVVRRQQQIVPGPLSFGQRKSPLEEFVPAAILSFCDVVAGETRSQRLAYCDQTG